MIAETLMCLALNVYHEARGEITAGQYAVSEVVMNRVMDPRYPDTVCEVVKEGLHWNGNPIRNRCAFSWYCDGRSDVPKDTHKWIQAQVIADNTFSGFNLGIVDGATHYHSTAVNPNWVNDNGMVKLGRIGNHVFYRWER